jgi:hypothetical protein
MGVVTQLRQAGGTERQVAQEASAASVELYWLPLGAGGWFVRLNGRIYEAFHALREHRRPLDLYHSALEVRVAEGRFVIENCWPIPDADGASRGGSWKARSVPAGWRASVRSGTRCAAGATGS